MVKHPSVRALLSGTEAKKMYVQHLDVKAALLYGETLRKEFVCNKQQGSNNLGKQDSCASNKGAFMA